MRFLGETKNGGNDINDANEREREREMKITIRTSNESIEHIYSLSLSPLILISSNTIFRYTRECNDDVIFSTLYKYIVQRVFRAAKVYDARRS